MDSIILGRMQSGHTARPRHLAESRLRRDAEVAGWAIEAIEKMCAGSTDLKIPNDPGSHGLTLVAFMREAMKSEPDDIAEPAVTAQCNVDLAVYQRENAVLDEAQRIVNSPEGSPTTARPFAPSPSIWPARSWLSCTSTPVDKALEVSFFDLRVFDSFQRGVSAADSVDINQRQRSEDKTLSQGTRP